MLRRSMEIFTTIFFGIALIILIILLSKACRASTPAEMIARDEASPLPRDQDYRFCKMVLSWEANPPEELVVKYRVTIDELELDPPILVEGLSTTIYQYLTPGPHTAEVYPIDIYGLEGPPGIASFIVARPMSPPVVDRPAAECHGME